MLFSHETLPLRTEILNGRKGHRDSWFSDFIDILSERIRE